MRGLPDKSGSDDTFRVRDNSPGKLPRAFGFTIEYINASMNLRNYEPDFSAIDKGGTH